MQEQREVPRMMPATSGLSDRDLRLVAWMGEQYGMRLDHIQTKTGTSSGMVRRIVRQLRRAELVRTERIVVGHPAWVIPTAAGLAVSGLPYPVWTPNLVHLAHISAINEVRLQIEAQKPEAEWISERQLLNETSKRPGRRGHQPDGVLILEDHSVAIEVELCAKRPATAEAILDDLSRRFDALLYYCAPKAYRQLKRLEQSERWRSLGVRELPRQRSPEGQ